MLDVSVVLSLLGLGLGLLVTYYYGRQRQPWGTILGLSVTVLGVFFALVEYAALSGPPVILAGVLGLATIFVFAFLAFDRDPRVLVLMGMPITILVGTYAYPFSILLFLEYIAVSVTMISAYDYSDARTVSRMNSVRGYLRAPVWLLISVYGLVRRIVERPSRGIIAIAYFALISAILVAAPLLLAMLSGDTVPPEPLIIVGLAYLYLTREAIARAAQPDGSSPLR